MCKSTYTYIFYARHMQNLDFIGKQKAADINVCNCFQHQVFADTTSEKLKNDTWNNLYVVAENEGAQKGK